MTVCSVPTCKNYTKKSNGISFFRIPKNSEVRKKWLEAIDVDEPIKEFRVCSKHFQESDYVFGATRKQLKKNAVPSLYLPGTDPFEVPKDIDIKCEPDESSLQYPHSTMDIEMELQNTQLAIAELRTLLENTKESARSKIESLEAQIKYLKAENRHLKKLVLSKKIVICKQVV